MSKMLCKIHENCSIFYYRKGCILMRITEPSRLRGRRKVNGFQYQKPKSNNNENQKYFICTPFFSSPYSVWRACWDTILQELCGVLVQQFSNITAVWSVWALNMAFVEESEMWHKSEPQNEIGQDMFCVKGGGRGGRTLGHNGRRKEEKGSLCRWIVIVQMIIEKISHEFEERKQEKKRGVQKHTELGLNQSAREDTDRMRV